MSERKKDRKKATEEKQSGRGRIKKREKRCKQKNRERSVNR